jgi:hypothetical protein
VLAQPFVSLRVSLTHPAAYTKYVRLHDLDLPETDRVIMTNFEVPIAIPLAEYQELFQRYFADCRESRLPDLVRREGTFGTVLRRLNDNNYLIRLTPLKRDAQFNCRVKIAEDEGATLLVCQLVATFGTRLSSGIFMAWAVFLAFWSGSVGFGVFMVMIAAGGIFFIYARSTEMHEKQFRALFSRAAELEPGASAPAT